MSCVRAPSNSSEDNVTNSTKPVEPNSIPLESQSVCILDAEEFRIHMGLGVMSLSIQPGDSITLWTTRQENETEKLIIHLSEYWKLQAKGKAESYFSPFKQASNFENYGFIWKSTDTLNSYQEVHVSNSDHTYWLHPSEKSKYQLITWESYLNYARISIQEDNPIQAYPSDESEFVSYPSGPYYVIEMQEQWIKIAPINTQNRAQSIDTMKSVGWVKWYCNKQLRIKILDDTLMETYYLD